MERVNYENLYQALKMLKDGHVEYSPPHLKQYSVLCDIDLCAYCQSPLSLSPCGVTTN